MTTIYDIFISPVKLECSGLVVRNRYAVMGDYRGGKKAPLNPAGTAIPSPVHSGIVEVNWPMRTKFEYPFQIPFTAAKARKEFQLSVLDGGPPTNAGANPANSKVVGECIFNVGDYCKVLDGDVCHRLVEVAFKMQGKPAILSLELLMVPHGIPAESVEASPELVARAMGGSGVGGATMTTMTNEKKPSSTRAAANHAAVAAAAAAGGGSGGVSRVRAGAGGKARILTVEHLSKLLSMGAIDDSVWVAANGSSIEVDADVGDELLSNLARAEAAEKKMVMAKQKMTENAAASGGGAGASNYEAQIGPIGECIFPIRTQRTAEHQLIAASMAESLQKKLESGKAFAQMLAPSMNQIYSVDMDKPFVSQKKKKAIASNNIKSPAEAALCEELEVLDHHMQELEKAQTRRDVTSDVCFILDRKAVIEEQLAALRARNGNTNTNTATAAGNNGNSGDDEGGLDLITRNALLQEIAATERAIELLEWRRRARAQLRQALHPSSLTPSEEALAALQRTLEPPMAHSFDHLPPKPIPQPKQPQQQQQKPEGVVGGVVAVAGGGLAAPKKSGGGASAVDDLFDDFGFTAPAATPSPAPPITTALPPQATMNATNIPTNIMNNAINSGATFNTVKPSPTPPPAAANTNDFDDFFGGGGGGQQQSIKTPSPNVPLPSNLVSSSPPMQQQPSIAAAGTVNANNVGDDFFGGSTSAAPLPVAAPPPLPSSSPAPLPPPPPVPSQWHVDNNKPPVWGAGAGAAPAMTAPLPPPPAAAAIATPSSSNAPATTTTTSGAEGGGPTYAQPQWQAPSSLANSIGDTAFGGPLQTPQQQQQNSSTVTAPAAGASLGASSLTVPIPTPSPPSASSAPQKTDLFGNDDWGLGAPVAAPPTSTAAPQQQQQLPPPPQQQQQQIAVGTVISVGGQSNNVHNNSTYSAPPSAPAPVQPPLPQQQPPAPPAAVASPPPQPQPQPQPTPPAVITPPFPSAPIVACTYGGNLLTPPFSRVTFDNNFQHLILQKEVGNVRLLKSSGGGSGIDIATIVNGAVVGGGGGEERRNGVIVRFAGGSVAVDGHSGPVTRGISGLLTGMTIHLETEDFFNPSPIEANAVLLRVLNNSHADHSSTLMPAGSLTSTPPNPPTLAPPNPFAFVLDNAVINALKPVCRGGEDGEERAIVVWPKQRGGGGSGGGMTLVFNGYFSGNGGVAVRRTVPIRF